MLVIMRAPCDTALNWRCRRTFLHVQFGVLGPLEVVDRDGNTLEVPGRQMQTLLALLILHAGEVVFADRLIDVLWNDDPPRSAANALQVQVSKLRKQLGATGEPAPVKTHGRGYVLQVEDDHVDAVVFTRILGDGRARLAAGDHRGAEQAFSRALGLWRGPAWAGFEFDEFVIADRARLDESRLGAIEDHVDVR